MPADFPTTAEPSGAASLPVEAESAVAREAQQRGSVRRDVALLTISTFAFAFYQGTTLTLAPLFMADLGFSKPTIGLLQAVPGLLVIFLGAPLAQLANTRFRRTNMVVLFGLAILASLLYSRAGSVATLAVPQLFLGIANAGFFSNMLATSFRLASGPEQNRIQALITTSQGIGMFVGPALGGYLSQTSYSHGFLASAVCSLVGLVAVALLTPSQDIERSLGFRRDLQRSYLRLFRVVTTRPVVLLGMGFIALYTFLLMVMGGSFFLVYASVLGLSTFQAAVLMCGRDLVSSVVRLGFGAACRLARPIVWLGLAVVLGAILLIFTPFALSFAELAIISFLVGAVAAFVPPAVNVLSGASVAPEEQSYAIVSLSSVHFLSQTFLAPVFGLALASFGYAVTYPIAGLIAIGLAVLLLSRGGRMIRIARRESS